MTKLKSLDKKILNLIQDEDLCVPRITKIAHKLQVPTSTVQARLNKLQEEEVIEGCTVLLNPEKVEKGFVAFVLGQARLGEKKDFSAIAEKIKKIEQVQEVFFITGDHDYLVKLRVKDHNEYYEVVQKVVQYFEVRGKGIIAPRCFKDTPKIKIE